MSSTKGLLSSLLHYLVIRFIFRPIERLLDLLQGRSYDYKTNLFMSENFAPVQKEYTLFDLPVTSGSIPSDLAGEFVRNGPNPVKMPRGGYHWFDGDGMLHGVRLTKDGRVSYINRQTKTGQFLEEQKYGHPLIVRLGEIYGWIGLIKVLFVTLKRKLGFHADLGGTANTALVFHNNKLQALVESHVPLEIRIFNDGQFEAAGQIDYGGKMQRCTAHPKVDPVTGEFFYFGYSFLAPFVQYGMVDAAGNFVRQFAIDTPVPTMMHDFAITERHALILDLALIFDPKSIVPGNFVHFDKNHKSRVGILDRYAKNADGIVWFSVPPCVVFHTINAWEEGDEVVLFTCRSNCDVFQIAALQNGSFGMAEWRFNLKTKEFKEQSIAPEEDCEFPQINYSLLGRKNKYAYLARTDRKKRINFDGLFKVDLETKQVLNKVLYGANKSGGEGVFVAKKNAKSEDDGYLLTFVYDKSIDKSSFWVLDSKNMTTVATVDLPQRVPNGFHGIFVSEEDIQSQLKN